MNINFKITTSILAVLLVVTFAWTWQVLSKYPEVVTENKTESNYLAATSMHIMPDGSLMMNDGSSMMDMTMNDMINDLKGKTGKDLEKAFIVGMIPHHQGAVDMAKILLQDKSIDPKFVKFGNDIITAQEGEINMMKEWLKSY